MRAEFAFMVVCFLGQPFRGSDQLGGVLGKALGDQAHTRVWVATAWAKRSGLGRLAPALEAFRSRGGTSELIVGVDEGGATVEGLELARSLFDAPFVFHDRGPRTFHPKIYVVEGADRATAIVGSGNLTKGGLYTNYECAVVCELEIAHPADAAFLADLRSHYDALLAQRNACRVLTDRLIEEIRSDPTVVVRPERKPRGRRNGQTRGGSTGGERLFGSSVPDLWGAPPPVQEARGDAEDTDSLAADAEGVIPEESTQPEAGGESQPSTGAGLPASTSVAHVRGGSGFFKVLAKNDVSGNSPGQIIIPLKFRDFFPSLKVSKDRSTPGGSRQLDAYFPILFRDGEYSSSVTTARVILYEPAEDNPRRNRELRFTFRNHEVSSRLSEDDVLAFTRDPDGGIVVERHRPRWRPSGAGSGRWAWI